MRFRKTDDPPISGIDALVVTQAAMVDDTARFTERCEPLNEELEAASAAARRRRRPAPRIMIAGCPSVMGNWKVLTLVESRGAVVVCDETSPARDLTHEHCRRDKAPDRGPLAAVADRYIEIPCACFSPNEERIERGKALAGEYRRRCHPICAAVLPRLQHRGHHRGRAPSRRPAYPV